MAEAWMNLGEITLVQDDAAVTSDANTIIAIAHGLADGDLIMVDDLTGGADILVVGAKYFARNTTDDTLQIAATRGGAVMDFPTTGTLDLYTAEPAYPALDLRRLDSGLLQRGDVSGGFAARPGVFPNASVAEHVTLTGTNWEVNPLTAVVDHSTAGPYRVAFTGDSGSLDPADGTNDRIDALDLQVRDDDEDLSGFRDSRIVYVVGTPDAPPSEPAVTVNALRLAVISVPAGGSPTPEVTDRGQFTVARGGIIPVEDSSSYPGPGGRYEGMMLWDSDADELVVNTNASGGWSSIASADAFNFAQTLSGWEFAFTAGGNTANSNTLTAIPGGPVATLDVPSSGNVLVMWGGRVEFSASTETPLARWRIQMSGANSGTVAGTSTVWSVRQSTGDSDANYQSAHSFHVETGLTPGSTTFTSEYAISTGSATFDRRALFLFPLG